MRRAARALLALLLLGGPGCVIPSSAGVGVISLTDTMWEGVVSASVEGEHDVELLWAEPGALRAVQALDTTLTVVSTWSDGGSHVHSGRLPAEPGQVVELVEEVDTEADPNRTLPGPELRVVVEGTGGSEAVFPGQTVSIAKDGLIQVEVEGEVPRPLARLGPISRREARTSVLRAAFLGTGAVIATPVTVALDAAWFVVSLPVLAVLLVVD